jgi:hypothetical protein
VRIPLDYYRILGLPIQAPAEQLKQAHGDRTHQMPRREYSENAIEARRALLDEAYAVLTDPDRRSAYDQRFFATTAPDQELSPLDSGSGRSETPDPTPHIDIADEHLVGALLILQELGEYELVLKVGRPYLSSGRLGNGSSSLKNGQFGDPNIALTDTVLTIALACLDLGREHWQQGQHETAAEALETGEELLVREGLFVGIRGEIQSDLLRLRPYRVLELLALPDQQYPIDRKKGLKLLQEMLAERDGIDGAGDDQSGLSIDDFLRFVQQLRGYLTAEEQQILFEEEARRPSAVATYLAIYALIARGFADHQPALIRRAKHLLAKLSARQDVHLEQSVCALLLGQTEEANRLLELSQEYEPIAFIREHSQGSPDWLPGLCLYAERWLGSEVFPHFRDLSQRHAALKDYFADEQVQMYLEELPADILEPAQRPSIGVADRDEDVWNDTPAVYPSGSSLDYASRSSRSALEQISVGRTHEALQFQDSDSSSETTVPESKGKDRSQSAPKNRGNTKSTKRSGSSKLDGAPVVGAIAAGTIATIDAGATHNAAHNTATEPNVKAPRPSQSDDRPRRIKGAPLRRTTKWRYPLWFPWALGCLGVMAMGLGFGRLSKEYANRNPQPVPASIVSTVPTEIPSQPMVIQGDLTNATAKQVLELWFTVKKAAMGSGYASKQLELALMEPKLSEWQRISSQAQRDGEYVEYEHAVDIKKVAVSATNPNEALVTANIRELRKYYEGNTIKNQQTDDLTLQYTLLRQNNQWKISTWQSAQS